MLYGISVRQVTWNVNYFLVITSISKVKHFSDWKNSLLIIENSRCLRGAGEITLCLAYMIIKHLFIGKCGTSKTNRQNGSEDTSNSHLEICSLGWLSIWLMHIKTPTKQIEQCVSNSYKKVCISQFTLDSITYRALTGTIKVVFHMNWIHM